MNIFYLDECPVKSAVMQCDKHVVKMVLETLQILSTALHCWGYGAPYKPTHINHPSCIWARESEDNFTWLSIHFLALCAEYSRRYGRVHKSQQYFEETIGVGNYKQHTSPPQCMPDNYRHESCVTAYRQYYQGDKAYMAKWKLNNKPCWFLSNTAV